MPVFEYLLLLPLLCGYYLLGPAHSLRGPPWQAPYFTSSFPIRNKHTLPRPAKTPRELITRNLVCFMLPMLFGTHLESVLSNTIFDGLALAPGAIGNVKNLGVGPTIGLACLASAVRSAHAPPPRTDKGLCTYTKNVCRSFALHSMLGELVVHRFHKAKKDENRETRRRPHPLSPPPEHLFLRLQGLAVAIVNILAIRRSGGLRRLAAMYLVCIGIIALVTCLLSRFHHLHIHHYIFFAALGPLGARDSHFGAATQGLCIGIAMQGAAQYGPATLWPYSPPRSF